MPFASVNGADIHYVESGAVEPLLLIPGRGIGTSSITPPPYTVESWADERRKL